MSLLVEAVCTEQRCSREYSNMSLCLSFWYKTLPHRYDYHGGCDLVLIKNDVLELHISTKPMDGYAGIDKAVVSFNNDETIEIDELGRVSIDGSDVTESLPSTVAGFRLRAIRTRFSGTQYDIIMSVRPEQKITITHFSHGLDVLVTANGASFAGSEGLCGSWDNGGVRDRDGNPFRSKDTHDWALEWQVTYGEHSFLEPYTDGECTPPPECSKGFPEGTFPCRQLEIQPLDQIEVQVRKDGGGRRKLGGLRKLQDDENAEEEQNGEASCRRTCNDIPPEFPEHKNNCVFDVIVSGDPSFAW